MARCSGTDRLGAIFRLHSIFDWESFAQLAAAAAKPTVSTFPEQRASVSAKAGLAKLRAALTAVPAMNARRRMFGEGAHTRLRGSRCELRE